MTKRYRVTQTARVLGTSHTKDYRWKWAARISAWINRGSASGMAGALFNEYYDTKVEEVEV